jgi:aryl-alcohol dehydrogenase-like predicted oxidoreductase
MGEDSALRRLGKSDLMVSPIGLGCWQFSKGNGFVGKFWPILSDDQIRETVDASLKGGVNWFDTAEVYGWGESEKALNRALKSLGTQQKDIVIATKWFPLFKTARSMMHTIDGRLRALDASCIDLHQIHFPGSISSTRSTMRAMSKLVQEEKIRYVGVSNYSAKQMRKAQAELSKFGLPLVSNQVEYSLLKRKIERNGVLDAAKELGIAIIAYSPLAQGILSGKFHDDPQSVQKMVGFRKRKPLFRLEGLKKSRPVIDALKELAEKYGATPAQIALNWVTQFHGNTVVAIPGATKVKQAEDNAGSMRFKLTKDELDHLDKISRDF